MAGQAGKAGAVAKISHLMGEHTAEKGGALVGMAGNETSEPPAGGTPSPGRSHLLVLPKSVHQLGAKHPNMSLWDHPHSSHLEPQDNCQSAVVPVTHQGHILSPPVGARHCS